MDFFKNKWVKIVCAVFVVVGAVGLLLGGRTEGELTQLVSLVVSAVGAIGAVFAFIARLLDGKDQKTLADDGKR